MPCHSSAPVRCNTILETLRGGREGGRGGEGERGRKIERGEEEVDVRQRGEEIKVGREKQRRGREKKDKGLISSFTQNKKEFITGFICWKGAGKYGNRVMGLFDFNEGLSRFLKI